jgi:hypothetical protein
MFLTALVASAPEVVCADVEPFVMRGVQYLRRYAGGSRVGEAALIGLAMLKADVPPNDPALVGCVEKARARFATGVYSPDRSGGADIYEVAVVAMLLANYDAETFHAELNLVAQYLTGKQKANGSWDYDYRTKGDTSISQYAVLGLWEADNAGATVHPAVWERAAQWFMSVESAEGSWNYHRDEGMADTVAMSAAGVGSLLICQQQLTRYRKAAEQPSPLLVPILPEGKTLYEVHTSNAAMEAAINRGLAWIGATYTAAIGSSVFGQSMCYGLYGIERIGALSKRELLGRANWYEWGHRYLVATQRGDGAWTGQHGDDMNTTWAILFVARSTAKTLKRIQVQRLGAGTLMGGKGLPRDLSTMTVAGGRVVTRPMNGAVEGMLAALEDPRSENAESALDGLVKRYHTEGPKVLRPHKDRFRKLLRDRDPGLRRVAAWALSRIGDINVIPPLIDALNDPDQDVVTAATLGLQLMSRKIVPLGPRAPTSPDQRRDTVKQWRQWYETVRPIALEGQSDIDLTDVATPRRSSP